MKSPSIRTRSCRQRLLAVSGLALLSAAVVACGPGARPSPARADLASPSVGPSLADSLRAEAANRRLLSAAALEERDASEVPSDYLVGVNDVIDVEVFNVDAFSGTFAVTEGGEIAIPLLGPVSVAGHTVREVEALLTRRLRETYVRDPHVTVRVGEVQSRGVSVIGAVRRPGVYQVAGKRTLLELLAMAEGLTEEAGNTVLLVRPARDSTSAIGAMATDSSAWPDSTAASVRPERVAEIDLGALLHAGHTEENLVVRPGDIVQVQPAGVVYVVGEVNRPGGFPVPPGEPMTVLQALAMAQGLGGTAAPGRTVIVREGPDGARNEVPVDLDEVLEGSAPPPLLAERDVLFVPKNGAKSFALGTIDALVRMVTLRGLVY